MHTKRAHPWMQIIEYGIKEFKHMFGKFHLTNDTAMIHGSLKIRIHPYWHLTLSVRTKFQSSEPIKIHKLNSVWRPENIGFALKVSKSDDTWERITGIKNRINKRNSSDKDVMKWKCRQTDTNIFRLIRNSQLDEQKFIKTHGRFRDYCHSLSMRTRYVFVNLNL